MASVWVIYLIILLCLITGAVPNEPECLNMIDYMTGLRLTSSSVFATVHQRTFHQCRKQCAFRTSCLVFTYTSSTGTCELASQGYSMENATEGEVLSSPTAPESVSGQCSGYVCPAWMLCVALTSGSNICIQPESDIVPTTTTTSTTTTTTTTTPTTTTPTTTTTIPTTTTTTPTTTTPTTTTPTTTTPTTTTPTTTTPTPTTPTTTTPTTTTPTTTTPTTTTPTTTTPTTTTPTTTTTTIPTTTTTTPTTTTPTTTTPTTTTPTTTTPTTTTPTTTTPTTTTPTTTTPTTTTPTTTTPTTTTPTTTTPTTTTPTTTTPTTTTPTTTTTTPTTTTTTPTTTTPTTTTTVFNISSYQVLDVLTDYQGAASACATVGGVIPDFKTQAEIDGIVPLLQNTTVRCPNCPVDGIVYENTSVIMTSPNYPQEYGCFTDCTCLLKAESGLKLTLHLAINNLESGCDYLIIYDGPNSTCPGFGKYYGTNVNHTLVSGSDEVFLRFTTDLSVTGAGFHLTVSTVDASVNSSGHTALTSIRALSKLFWIGGSMSDLTQTWLFSDGSTVTNDMVPDMDYGWDYYNYYDYYYEGLPLVDFRRALTSTGEFQALLEDWQCGTICGLP